MRTDPTLPFIVVIAIVLILGFTTHISAIYGANFLAVLLAFVSVSCFAIAIGSKL